MKKFTQLSIIILTISLFVSCESPIEVSPEMQAFMAAVTSTESMDEAAEKYGYKNDDMPLGYYTLGKCKVTATNVEGTNTCYTLNVNHGLVDSNVKVCWEGKKLVSITEAPLE